VAAAAAQDGLWLVGDGAAVSVWVPPGRAELPPDDLVALVRFNEEWLGAEGAREIAELYDRFDSNHPTREAHAYLSLLATHRDHHGRGIGQMLLARNLAAWDEQGIPAYLESTNPANDHRYERAGFRRVGGFSAVRDGAPISTMWREVGGARPR
jgi:GNAT superfamily N-acetyltransferase